MQLLLSNIKGLIFSDNTTPKSYKTLYAIISVLTLYLLDPLCWTQLQVRLKLPVAFQAEHPSWRVEEEG